MFAALLILQLCKKFFYRLTRIRPLPGNCEIDSSLALISFSLMGLTRTTTLILSSSGVELPDDFSPISSTLYGGEQTNK
jgi:hypothetical protein